MEKPDFKSIASKFYYDNHNLDIDQIVSEAMELVWSSHVEPLQKENERLKEERDSFAIGFAEWINGSRFKVSIMSEEKLIWIRNFSYKKPDEVTTAELLELYKETKND